MSKTYSWRIASEDEFHKIYALIYQSESRDRWDVDHIRRRVIIPLFLEQLITFYDQSEKLRGFLTYALMDAESACHQASDGVLPMDWRSGRQLWIVDFVSPFGDGDKMIAQIRRDTSGAVSLPIRYFRLKHKQVRRIGP